MELGKKTTRKKGLKINSITLRPLNISDAKAFMTWGGDPEVTQSLFWDHYKNLESAKKFIEDIAQKHPWFMAICEDENPVGTITLDQGKNQASIRAELGYVISKSFWNKGITTEAVKLALQRGFEDLDIKRIESFVDPENKGSIKVLEKNGFKCEGILKNYVIHRGKIRDRLLYAITN